jgi:endoglucanase
VYIPNSAQPDRVFWYETVRQYLEEKGISWTSWDYHGGFGLFEEGGNDLFEHDLNVSLLEAMGFNVPSQSEYIKQAETAGFPIYTDLIASNFFESSSGESTINYYSQDKPNNDKYCIRWENAAQYQHIGLDSKPNKDLSLLVDQGYALDLMFRGNQPVTFDLRFIDTDTEDPQDHPWRMRFTIDENSVPFDSRWHHMFIPLEDFSEQGAWEGQWFPPEGKFDWADIDRLEIVAEHEDLGSATLWFDNVHITNLDTAQVNDHSVFEDLVTSVQESGLNNSIRVYPNPAYNKLVIERIDANVSTNSILSSHPHSHSIYHLMDNMGRVVISSTFGERVEVDISALPAGVYLVRTMDGMGISETARVLKLSP